MDLITNVGNTSDVLRPSLFELFAQDRLNLLFRPALRYVITGRFTHNGIPDTCSSCSSITMSYMRC